MRIKCNQMKRIYPPLILACWIQLGLAAGQAGISGRCFTPTLENGWVEAQENMRGDSFVGRFRCQPGFVLSGASTVKCRQGRWSVRPDNFPLCAAIGSCQADQVPHIKNGFQAANPRYADSVYRYTCKKGYRLLGVTTIFCTQTGWSQEEAPVCTRPGCPLENLMGEDGIKNGRARPVWGGAAFRFSCNAGSLLEGNQVVFCDGKKWNGTKPECLVPPSSPTLSLTVDDVPMENPSLSVGQNLTMSCNSSGGNPAPGLALYLGPDMIVSSSAGSTAQYTLTVQTVHDTVQVYCAAHNRMSHSPVLSPVHLLSLKCNTHPVLSFTNTLIIPDPADNVYIRGSDLVMAEDYVQYSCSSDEADPAPRMEVIVSDQNGDDISVTEEKMPIMKGRKGFAAKIVFGVHFEDHIKIAKIECRAVNEVGEAAGKMITRVQYSPENVDISGNTVVKHNDEKAVYFCSSSQSFPEPDIVWKKLVGGKLVKMDENAIEVKIEDTGEGIIKNSKLTLYPSRAHEESFILFCIVKIPELKFERSSDLLDVLITYPPKRIFIAGPDSVVSGDEVQFTCVVEGGNPFPNPILVITDQYQNALPTIITSNTSVSLTVGQDLQTVYASCFAGNEAGYLQNTKEVPVYYPPSGVTINGPDYLEDGVEANYKCTSLHSFPPAVMEWKVVSARGDHVEYVTGDDTLDVTDDTAEDDKQTVSHLTITGHVSRPDLTVHCTATNPAGSAVQSLSTPVKYLPEHILLTGPTILSTGATATYYCSTDHSLPLVTLDWGVNSYAGLVDTADTIETVDDKVETYETALEDGGVQTYSVLTLPQNLVSNEGKLRISCQVREAPEDLELHSQMDVTIEALGLEKNTLSILLEENMNQDDSKYQLVNYSSSGENETEMDENAEKEGDWVKLEAVDSHEYDDYNTAGMNRHADIENLHKESLGYDAIDDYDIYYYDDAIGEPSFHKSEAEALNAELKLEGRPTQHVELSRKDLYSSASKLGLKLNMIITSFVIARL